MKGTKGTLVVASLVVGGGLFITPASQADAFACGDPLPQGSEPVTLAPYNFVTQIDSKYWPMAPGSRWIYAETDRRGDVAKVEVHVTDRTKTILGIQATVVRDTVSESGEKIEDTRDWYAQDVCGNIWYLGENTKEYEDGKVVSTEGSWQAGVDGAQPGVVVPGDPQPGLSYREEYYKGEAEDAAEVLAIGEQVRVPAGHFRHAMLTHNVTPLEPRVLEYKLYAPGVGPVEEIGISGGSDRAELLRYHLA